MNSASGRQIRFAEHALNLSTGSSKTGRQSRIQEIIKLDPSPNGRQHERGLNWRTRRIRTRYPGVRAKPWGFGLPSTPIILEMENGPEPQETMESLAFPDTGGRMMASTKSRLEIGTVEWWLPGMDSNHDSRLQRPLSYH